jgi:aspartate racemase
MIDLSVVAALKQLKDGDLVGMLASPAVETTGLFDKAFARHGFETLWPKGQQKMLAAIKLVKSRGPCDESRDIFAPGFRGALLTKGRFAINRLFRIFDDQPLCSPQRNRDRYARCTGNGDS